MRPEISAHTAAHETHIVESSKPFLFHGRSRVGPRLEDRAWLFAPIAATATIHHFVFRDAVFAPASGLLLREDKAVAETRYLLGDEDYDRAMVVCENVIEHTDDQHVIIGANNAFRDYYHWLIQALPAIHAAFCHAPEEVYLALPPLASWQERTIELLALPPHSRLKLRSDRQYRFRSAEYSEYLNGTAAFSISLVAQDAFQCMKRNAVTSHKPDSELIYVAEAHPNCILH